MRAVNGGPSTDGSRARRATRTILAVVVLPLIVGLVAVVVLTMTPWGNERVRRIVVSQANTRMLGQLEIGSLRGNLLGGATLRDVSLMDSAHKPVFTARAVTVRYALLPALRGHAVIRAVTLDTPYVLLDKRPGERWNFQRLMKPKADTASRTRGGRTPPEISNVVIHHGHFEYRRPWRPDTALTPGRREAEVAAALRVTARKRTVRVPNGYQRLLDYRDIDARLPQVAVPGGAAPTRVEIAALSMIAEPYRPPVIDVRSLAGTLFASKDSLWWRGAHMRLPASKVTGDGTIGFHKSGFMLDLQLPQLALNDLRWLDPKLPTTGGGAAHYIMRLHGDSANFVIRDANLQYADATVRGEADVLRIKPKGKPAEVVVHGANVRVANLTTEIVHRLAPQVMLSRSGTLNGQFAVSGSPQDLQLDADVRFDDRASGTSRILAKGGIGFDHGFSARDLSVDLRPIRLGTVRGAGVKLPLDGTISGTATVSGAMHDGWNVRGDLTHVNGSERSHVVGSGRYAKGSGQIEADARLLPLDLATVAHFLPNAGLHGTLGGDVHAHGTARDLRINGTLRAADGGTIRGRAALARTGSRTRYDVNVAVDALNANVLSTRAPRTLLTGTLLAKGSGTSPRSADAVFAVDLTRARYDTFALDRVRAAGHTRNGLLTLTALEAAQRGVRLSANGTFGLVADRRGTLHFALDVDSLGALRPWLGTAETGVVALSSGRRAARVAAARADSARRAESVRIERIALGLPEGVELVPDSVAPIRRDSLAGRLQARGLLLGNVKELGVDATIRGVGLVARGNAVAALDATVSSPDIRRESAPLSFRVAADSVRAMGYAFDRVDASGRRERGEVIADLQVRQDSLVSYAALGRYAHPSSGVHDITLDSLRAVFDTVSWRLAHKARVRLSHGDVRVDSVDLRGNAGGRLFANGVVPKNGAIHLDVAAEAVRVNTVLAAMQREVDADGVLAASARIDGTRAEPVINGQATLRDGAYKGQRAIDADVGLRYAAQHVGLTLEARDSTGRRVATGMASAPYDLALSGVSGSRKLPGAVQADLVLDSLALGALPVRTRAVEDLHGTAVAALTVRGSWADLRYGGTAALRNAGLTLAATGMSVDSATADLHFAADTLVLDSLVARAGGPLRASGTVSFADRSHPFVNISASGTDLRVFDSPKGLVDADARILARGPLDALRVTGRGEMKGGFLALKQFRKDLLRVKAPGALSFFAVFDTTAEANDSVRIRLARETSKRVAIIADLELVIDRGNYYRNKPDASTEFYTGDGEVVLAHVDQRTSDQWIVGFVRIGDGHTYFRTQAFTPVRGTLTFGPHTDAPGIVQQVGQRIVWEPGRGSFPLQLLTAGTSKGPSIGLESGTLFPIRGRELNGYLTMGRATTSLLQQSGSSLSGSEAWSGQLSGETGALAHRQQGATALGVVLHDLGTGAAKEFSLDAFSVSPADVPTELVFGKTGGVRGALVEGGKYLGNDRYVAGQFRFTRGIPGARFVQKFGTLYRLDMGIEPRFLFSQPVELGITHPTLRTGAFGAFLTRLWDF